MHVTLLPQTLSACASATDGMEHGNESHVNEANVLTEHAAEEPLAVHPAVHFAVRDSESAMLITDAATTVSLRFACNGGSANVLTKHAAVEPLAAHPAAQFTVHDAEPAILVTPAASAVSMSSTPRSKGARGWIARET